MILCVCIIYNVGGAGDDGHAQGVNGGEKRHAVEKYCNSCHNKTTHNIKE